MLVETGLIPVQFANHLDVGKPGRSRRTRTAEIEGSNPSIQTSMGS
jgi:hypothetical protein